MYSAMPGQPGGATARDGASRMGPVNIAGLAGNNDVDSMAHVVSTSGSLEHLVFSVQPIVWGGATAPPWSLRAQSQPGHGSARVPMSPHGTVRPMGPKGP